jgi:hypothetical protein
MASTPALLRTSLALATRSRVLTTRPTAFGAQLRSKAAFSSYVLDNFGGSASSTSWPITKTNMGFNIVPQGHMYVVERFGKVHSIENSGWFLGIPLVDRIAYVIDVREKAIDIPPQSAITRDNVSVEVSGNLFVKFVDPEKAAYGAFNPLYSVTQVSHGTACIHMYAYL